MSPSDFKLGEHVTLTVEAHIKDARGRDFVHPLQITGFVTKRLTHCIHVRNEDIKPEHGDAFDFRVDCRDILSTDSTEANK